MYYHKKILVYRKMASKQEVINGPSDQQVHDMNHEYTVKEVIRKFDNGKQKFSDVCCEMFAERPSLKVSYWCKRMYKCLGWYFSCEQK